MKRLIIIALAATVSTAAVAQTQVSGMEYLFDRADLNGDGVISRDEFLQVRADAFADFDTDHSGSLSQAELSAALNSDRAKRFVALAFSKIDTNGDGKVSHSEWNNNPPRIFDRADSNGDNNLTSDELSARQR